MMKNIKLIFVIMSILFGSLNASIKVENFKDNANMISQLNWKPLDKKYTESNLLWKESSDEVNKKVKSQSYKDISNTSRRFYDIKSTGKSININNKLYPEISNYVPNGFIEDWEKAFTASFRGISQTRHCSFNKGGCYDGVLDIDFNLINLEDFSFNPKINIQSLTNRGTKRGQGISLGFKAAKNISPKWSIAFGGENIIHFDDTIDLGRNFYLVSSTYIPLANYKNSIPSMIFINAGVGSDFFGYKGNGFIGTTSCLGKPTLTGEGSENCNWGPIGSIAFVFNERFSLINEWFGYSYGSGFSYKPFRDSSVVFSIYATDFINGFPKYASEGCPDNSCSTRFYGSLSLII